MNFSFTTPRQATFSFPTASRDATASDATASDAPCTRAAPSNAICTCMTPRDTTLLLPTETTNDATYHHRISSRNSSFSRVATPNTPEVLAEETLSSIRLLFENGNNELLPQDTTPHNNVDFNYLSWSMTDDVPILWENRFSCGAFAISARQGGMFPPYAVVDNRFLDNHMARSSAAPIDDVVDDAAGARIPFDYISWATLGEIPCNRDSPCDTQSQNVRNARISLEYLPSDTSYGFSENGATVPESRLQASPRWVPPRETATATAPVPFDYLSWDTNYNESSKPQPRGASGDQNSEAPRDVWWANIGNVLSENASRAGAIDNSPRDTEILLDDTSCATSQDSPSYGSWWSPHETDCDVVKSRNPQVPIEDSAATTPQDICQGLGNAVANVSPRIPRPRINPLENVLCTYGTPYDEAEYLVWWADCESPPFYHYFCETPLPQNAILYDDIPDETQINELSLIPPEAWSLNAATDMFDTACHVTRTLRSATFPFDNATCIATPGSAMPRSATIPFDTAAWQPDNDSSIRVTPCSSTVLSEVSSSIDLSLEDLTSGDALPSSGDDASPLDAADRGATPPRCTGDEECRVHPSRPGSNNTQSDGCFPGSSCPML